jgi:hypothetical protein
MKKRFFIPLLISTGLFVFWGCNLDFNKDKNDGFRFDEKTFVSEWNLWKNEDIRNYSFTMTGELPNWNFSRAILMFEYKVNIIVKDGIVNTFEYIGDVPQEEDGTIFEPEFTSISDMYQKIFNRAKEGKEWWEKYSGRGGFISTTFEIRYDPQLHYITFFEPIIEVESDFILDTTNHAVSISNFTILN